MLVREVLVLNIVEGIVQRNLSVCTREKITRLKGVLIACGELTHLMARNSTEGFLNQLLDR